MTCNNIGCLVDKLSAAIINPLLALLFAVAFVVFVWGLVEFIYGSEDQSAREKGKKHMIYGVLGISIMVAAVAIVQILKGTVS